uniref:Nonsense-mediated mRNA decay factor SMG8 n=1 Tax=Evadne anonyx TaxID=141404 RepID=A0A9N6WXD8_9CRUS|nr:EOG090X02WG [Evadne anonyx]
MIENGITLSWWHKGVKLQNDNVYDANTLNSLLNTIEENIADKEFQHVWSNSREMATKHFLFLFLVSHIIIITNPSCNFDLNYIQLFKKLESVRSKFQPGVSEILKTVPGLPKDWLTLGRLCSPRVLFYFEKKPPSHSENLKSLQHLMEDQIYRLLRKCRIITNVSTNSLFAVPANQEFVYFQTEQKDMLTFLLDLLNESFDVGVDNSDFREFLHQHVNLALTKGFSDNVGRHVGPSMFVLPPASVWFDASFKLYDYFTSNQTEDSKGSKQLRSLLDVEGQFSEARCSKVLPLALAAYQENLPSHYSSQNHENKKTQAKALLCSHGRGEAVQRFILRLDAECDRIWKQGRRMCEVPSISGNPCIQPVHSLHQDENSDSKLAVMPHVSGVRYVSACSCGRRQANREDPYDVKYANYEFYRLIEEDCCARLHSINFLVFKPSSEHFKAAQVKESAKSAQLSKEVDKLIAAAEEMSLGPDENEFPALSVNHLSPDDVNEEEFEVSPGKIDTTEMVEEESVIEVTDTQDLPTTSHQDVSTTEYLPCMLHVNSPNGILPRYSSWSLVCLGPSSLYSHNSGLSDQPGFLTGSGFLLPWDVTVRVQRTETTVTEGRRPYVGYFGKGKRGKQGQYEFTVKIFIGVEYECPRGHRFMSSSPGHVLKATGAGLVKDSAQYITSNDVPLYLPCPCPYSRGEKTLIAQLMRVHIVTPKAPVFVTLDPKVRPAPPPCPEFVTGFNEPIKLTPSSYWILRFPYLYEDENEIHTPPKEGSRAAQHGFLLKGTYGVVETVVDT